MLRRFLITVTILFVAGNAAAYIDPLPNTIGIYFDEDAENTSTVFTGSGLLTTYIVATNPFSTDLSRPITIVGGFETAVEFPASWMLASSDVLGGTNFVSAPEFVVGGQYPVVNGVAVMAEIQFFVFTPSTEQSEIVLYSPGYTFPDDPALTDFNNYYNAEVARHHLCQSGQASAVVNGTCDVDGLVGPELVRYSFEGSAADSSSNYLSGDIIGGATTLGILEVGDNASDAFEISPLVTDGLQDFTFGTYFSIDAFHIDGGTEPQNTLFSVGEDSLTVGVMSDRARVILHGTTYDFSWPGILPQHLYHLAVTREGGTLTVLFDGNWMGEATVDTRPLAGIADRFLLGQDQDPGGVIPAHRSLLGRLDEFIVHDAAVVPTVTPFPVGQLGTIQPTDSSGDLVAGYAYATITGAYIRLTDPDMDFSPLVDNYFVHFAAVVGSDTVDIELVNIVETGGSTGEFAGGLEVDKLGVPTPGDGVLQLPVGPSVVVYYDDPLQEDGVGQVVTTVLPVAGADPLVTWALSDSPVLLDATVEIPQWQTLRIEAGVEVNCTSSGVLTIWGNLECQGAPGDSVVFNTTDSWYGIYFYGGGSNHLQMDYCVVEGAAVGLSIQGGTSGTVSVTHSRFSDGDRGIYANLGISPTDMEFRNCRFERSTFDGLLMTSISARARNSAVLVDSCVIVENDRAGIIHALGDLTVTGTTCTHNADNGIYIDAVTDPGAELTFRECILELNTGFDLYNGSFRDVDAQHSWWGETITTNMAAGVANISTIYDAYDNGASGFVDFANWLILVDTTAPVLTLVGSVPPASVTAEDTIQFNWSATDNLAPADSLEYSWQLTPVDPWSEWALLDFHEFVDLPDGYYTFEVRVRDTFDNQDQSSHPFSIDSEPPETIAVAGPAPGEELSWGSVDFTWRGVDAAAAPENLMYRWRLDGGAWSDATSDTMLTLPPPDFGAHVFEVVAQDPAGWEDLTPASWSFSVVYEGILVAGSVPVSTVWTVADGPYLIQSRSVVSSSDPGTPVSLTIEPGTVVEFAPGASLVVGSEDGSGTGFLHAVGTAGEPITFQAFPAGGNPEPWVGMEFTEWAVSEQCSLVNSVVVMAGSEGAGIRIDGSSPHIEATTVSGALGDGISITGNALPILRGNILTQNAGHGIAVRDSLPRPLIVVNQITNNDSTAVSLHPATAQFVGDNTITNNGIDEVVLRGGAIPVDTVWPATAQGFLIQDDIMVRPALPGGPTIVLTIAPGATLRFAAEKSLTIGDPTNPLHLGALVAEGTIDTPVTFTTAAVPAVPGGWGWVQLSQQCDGPATRLEFCYFEYGGFGDTSNLFINGCVPSKLEYLRLENAAGFGLITYQAPVVISNSDFINNSYGGISNGGPDTVTAVNNWWGDPSGPSDAGPGTGQAVTGDVLFDPWLMQYATIDHAPVLSFVTAPVDSSLLPLGDVPFTWDATDDWTDPAALEFAASLDGAEFSPWSARKDSTLTGLGGGHHTFAVRARDERLNESEIVRAFFIDVTSPVLTLGGTVPAAGVTAADTIRFTWSAQDDLAPAESLEYSWQLTPGDPWSDWSALLTYEFADLPQGFYNFEVKVRDTVGNEDQSSHTFSVDREPPETTTVAGPAPGEELPWGSVDFVWRGFDVISDPADLLYRWRLDGGEWSDADNDTMLTLSPPDIGSHIFEVAAQDPSGWVDPTPASWSFSIVYEGTLVAGPVPASTIWTAADGPYLVQAKSVVSSSDPGTPVTLTIEPGTVVEFAPGASLVIGSEDGSGTGALQAVGTVGTPISFQAFDAGGNPAPWTGISFTEWAVSEQCSLVNCSVVMAGMGGAGILISDASPHIEATTVSNAVGDGIAIVGDAQPTLLGNTITGNDGHGVTVRDAVPRPVIVGNEITSNDSTAISLHPATAQGVGNNTLGGNGIDAVTLRGGEIGTDTVWPATAQGFQALGDITVLAPVAGNPSAVLTIDPGATIRFAPETQLTIGDPAGADRRGTLVAEGTVDAPVTLTTATVPAAPGGWKGVYLSEQCDGPATRLEFCYIEYGGYGNAANLFIQGCVPGHMEFMRLENAAGHGMRVGAAPVVIRYSDFQDNTIGGIFNFGPDIVTALDNWWGDPSGPSGEGTGTGESVNEGVLFDPWWLQRATLDNPPTLSFVTAPADSALLTVSDVSFVWDATDDWTDPAVLQFATSLDGAQFSPWSARKDSTLTGLADGYHTFAVRALDAGLNESEVVSAFFIDATPPDVVFTGGPSDGATTVERDIDFAWQGIDAVDAPEDLTYEYRLDGWAWVDLGHEMTLTLSDLGLGTHTLLVRATDRAGYVDPTPAELQFTVAAWGTIVAARITDDATWTVEGSPYFIDEDLLLASLDGTPVTLTVESGVELRFAPGTRMTLGAVLPEGPRPAGLLVQGTGPAPVVFTVNAEAPSPGAWVGLLLSDISVVDQVILDHAVIEYAGAEGASVEVSGGNPVIRNSTVRDGAGVGVRIHDGTPLLQTNTITDHASHGIEVLGPVAQIDGNTLSRNGGYPLVMSVPSIPGLGLNTASYNLSDVVAIPGGVLTDSATWPDVGMPYHLQADLTVHADASTPAQTPVLTLTGGVEMAFANDAGLIIGGLDGATPLGGALRAEGTVTAPVVLRAHPTGGRWVGVSFTPQTDDAQTLLTSCRIEGGHGPAGVLIDGSSPRFLSCEFAYNDGHGMEITGDAAPELLSCEFRNNGGAGLVVLAAAADPTIGTATFTDNGSYAALLHPHLPASFAGAAISGHARNLLAVVGETILRDTLWPVANAPYLITGVVTVAGAQPGEVPVLTVEPGVEMLFESGAGLTIGAPDGTLAGSLNAAASAETPILMTSVETSPTPGDWVGVYLTPGCDLASFAMSSCYLEYGGAQQNANLFVEGVSPTLSNLLLANSSGFGMIASNSDVVLHDSDIILNVLGGVSNLGGGLPDVTNNWWGALDGPGGDAGGSGQSVSGDLIYDPWLTDTATVEYPPTVSIITGPAADSYAAAADVDFGWTGVDDALPATSLEYSFRLDDGTWSLWASVLTTTVNVTEGEHTFSVQVREPGGLEGEAAASRTFRYDVTTPVVTQESGPLTGTEVASRDVLFRWSGLDNVAADTDLTYAWTLDGGPLSEWSTATAQSLEGLSLGAHDFILQARDPAGNVLDPALTVSFTVALPDLMAIAVAGPDTAWFSQPVTVTWDATNAGAGTAPAGWQDAVYISTDDVFDDGDVLLGRRTQEEDIAASTPYLRTTDFTVPPDLVEADYRLLLVIDDLDEVFEDGSEANNVVAATADITLLTPTHPDLVISSITHPTGAWAGQALEVAYTVTNDGTAPAGPGWTDRVYLSGDETFGNDQLLGEFVHNMVLDPGTPSSFSEPVTIPGGLSGQFWVIVVTDFEDDIQEFAGETGNTVVGTQSMTVQYLTSPDLVVATVTGPTTTTTGSEVTVYWTVRNAGTGPSDAPLWYDRLYASPTPQLGGEEIELGEFINPRILDAGQSYSTSHLFTLPPELVGPYYFLVVTDARSHMNELDAENNNLNATSGTIDIVSPTPLLKVESLVLSVGQTSPGELVNMTWIVANNGQAEFPGTDWSDGLFFGAGTLHSAADSLMIEMVHTGPLAPGERDTLTTAVRIPDRPTGTYHFTVKPGLTGAEGVTTVSRSTSVAVVPALAADLVVTAVTATDSVLTGGAITVVWTVLNTGEGPSDVPGWTDRVWLTSSPIFSLTGAYLLGGTNVETYLEPDETYEIEGTYNVPSGYAGVYYVHVETDALGQVFEASTANNVGGSGGIFVELTPPDLQITVFDTGDPVAGLPLDLNWTVANAGVGATQPDTWYDLIHISDDGTLDGGDRTVASIRHDGNLNPGESYAVSTTITLDEGLEGPHWFFLTTDANGQLSEVGGEDNNEANLARTVALPSPPDLFAISHETPDPAWSNQPFSLHWLVQVENLENIHVASWLDYVYVSADSVLSTTTDTYLAQAAVSITDVGEFYTASASFNLPQDRVGPHYLLIDIDRGSVVYESDDGNNLRVVPIDIQATPVPDLTVTNAAAPDTARAGTSVGVQWIAENIGAGSLAGLAWYDDLYLSTSATYDSGNRGLRVGRLVRDGDDVGDGYFNDQTVAIPSHYVGTYYLHFVTDALNGVYERADEGNNVATLPVVITPVASQLPDLAVTAFSAPDEVVVPGPAVTVSWTVRNISGVATLPAEYFWYDAVYLSDDAIWDESDLLLRAFSHSGSLGPSAQYQSNELLALPDSVAGSYQLILRTNIDGTVSETDETNNTRAEAVTVNRYRIDLQVAAVTLPGTVVSGQPLTVDWTVTNAGDGTAAQDYWYDSVYLSADQVFDDDDILLGTRRQDGPLAAAGGYAGSLTEGIPLGLAGIQYAFVVTDGNGSVYEHEAEDNNRAGSALPVQIVIPAPADLLATAASVSDTVGVGEFLTVNWTVENAELDPASGTWWDGVYLSADPVYDSGDVEIGTVIQTLTLPAGQTYAGQLVARAPAVPRGTYYILTIPDVHGNINETDDANNYPGVGGSAEAPQVYVRWTELTGGVVLTDQVDRGVTDYFYAVTPAYQELRFTLAADFDFDTFELQGAWGRVPTRADWDFALAASPSAELVVSAPADTDLYLTVSGLDISGLGQYDVRWDELGFELESVTPMEAGNIGFNRLTLTGGQLEDVETVLLRRAGEEDLTAYGIEPVDGSRIRARFDLRDAATGSYDILAVAADSDTARLDNGIYVRTGDGPIALPLILGPGVVRLDQPSDYSLQLGNEGDSDAMDVVTLLEMPAGTGYQLIAGDWSSPVTTTDGEGELLLLDLLPTGVTSNVVLRLWSNTRLTIAATPLTDVGIRRLIGPELEVVHGTWADHAGEAFRAALGAEADDVNDVLWGFVWYGSWTDASQADTWRTLRARLAHVGEKALDQLVILGYMPPFDPDGAEYAAVVETAMTDLRARVLAEVAMDGQRTVSRDLLVSYSWDPNEKHGPSGLDDAFVVAGDPITYTLYFENEDSAPKAARRVLVEDELDTSFNYNHAWLHEIKVGSLVIEPDYGATELHERYLLEDDVWMQVDAEIDYLDGRVTLLLQTVDRFGNEYPDLERGCLPPNDFSHRGEGHITFLIETDENLLPNATIPNDCVIYFDDNPPITTPNVVATIRQAFPDLVCQTGALQPVPLLEQGPVSITTQIANSGELPVENATVSFYSGDPASGGTPIEENLVLGALSPGDEVDVTISWVLESVADQDSILIVVDPDDNVLEVDEQNNQRWLVFNVVERDYELRLAAGLNLISPPLQVDPPQTAVSFGQWLGADVVIRMNADGRFESYMVNDQLGNDFAVDPGQGYIVSMPGGTNTVISGVTAPGTVSLNAGLNMIGIPVEQVGLTAADLAGILNATMVMDLEPGLQVFRSFVPGFNATSSFDVIGGRGYLVSSPVDTSVTFTGVGWQGAQPLPGGAKADTQGKPVAGSVLAVGGRVMVRSGPRGGTAGYAAEGRVVVHNLRSGAVCEAELNPTNGSFGAAFVMIGGSAAVLPGDVLAIEVHGPQDEVLGEFGSYAVSSGDIEAAMVNLGEKTIDIPPVMTMVARNYPNPFNPKTTIYFQLAKAGRVSLRIYDVRGRLVRTLVDEHRKPGYYEETWAGKNDRGHGMASSVYLYRFLADGIEQTYKMVLIK